jgi:hypothetical protein
MKLVYLAGKITDKRGNWYVLQHTMEAAQVAVRLWSMGLSVVTPHLNTFNMGGAVSYEQFLQGDFEIIRRSDALVVIPNWVTSDGTKREMRVAYDAGKPVFYWPNDEWRLVRFAKGEDDQYQSDRRSVDSQAESAAGWRRPGDSDTDFGPSHWSDQYKHYAAVTGIGNSEEKP